MPKQNIKTKPWDRTNEDRRATAELLCETYRDVFGPHQYQDPEDDTLYIDLIADVLHLAHYHNQDPAQIVRLALDHAMVEIEEGDDDAVPADDAT